MDLKTAIAQLEVLERHLAEKRTTAEAKYRLGNLSDDAALQQVINLKMATDFIRGAIRVLRDPCFSE